MSDTRLTVKELKEELNKLPDEAVIISFHSGCYWPYYRVIVPQPDRWADILLDLNGLLGERLPKDTKFILLK